MKERVRWHSERLQREVDVVRWGAVGTPVLLFPTAGGDAEEIERFLVIDCLASLLEKGKIKVYSTDSVAGAAIMSGEGAPRQRGWLQNQFHEFIFHEVVPAIRTDCNEPEIEVIAAGSSIGAFNALASVCRFPSVFSHAVCLSGTYDLTRFFDGDDPGPDFFSASPLHFLSRADPDHVERIRERFVLFASGEGRAEDIGESWRAAKLLGANGIPNRVDSWGPEWHHDWPTWREMLPRYLAEFA